MNKKLLILMVCLTAVVSQASGQSRSKRVRQPREVVEAFRVCAEFRRLLAEDLDFDRAFEATFVKTPTRRREIAIAESNLGVSDLSQVDDATLVEIYKNQSQILILMLPLVFLNQDEKEDFSDPTLEAIIARVRREGPHNYKDYAHELKRGVAELRAHVDKRAAQSASVAQGVRQYKDYLLKPLEPPNRIVKPLTAYSKRRVLPLKAKYYQIDDCAVVREGGQMKLIGYTFFSIRW